MDAGTGTWSARAARQLSSAARHWTEYLPSPRSLWQIPLLSTPFTPQAPVQRTGQSASCPNAQLSCHNSTIVENTCCFNSPGGQILQTQFWDTNPPVGPSDSWTIHGLWPDHCDGGFDQYCDSQRAYHDIAEILDKFGEVELHSYMKKYWKDYQGSDGNLWQHEWNKHGTCISTMETSCYTDYVFQEEVVDYFEKTVELFKKRPTYETLAAAGIVPTRERTYYTYEIEEVLQGMHGAPVTVRCRNGEFNEVWYHFEVKGSAQVGQWIASRPDGAKSNCPRRIQYLPKETSSVPTTTATSKTLTTKNPPHPPTATSTKAPKSPFTGAGFLEVLVDGSTNGCLISDGSWYTSGSCATYHPKDDPSEIYEATPSEKEHLFTLSTRKGPCGFVEGSLACDRRVGIQNIFSDAGDGILAWKSRSQFWADKEPGHAHRGKVFSEKGDHSMELQISWKAR